MIVSRILPFILSHISDSEEDDKNGDDDDVVDEKIVKKRCLVEARPCAFGRGLFVNVDIGTRATVLVSRAVARIVCVCASPTTCRYKLVKHRLPKSGGRHPFRIDRRRRWHVMFHRPSRTTTLWWLMIDDHMGLLNHNSELSNINFVFHHDGYVSLSSITGVALPAGTELVFGYGARYTDFSVPHPHPPPDACPDDCKGDCCTFDDVTSSDEDATSSDDHTTSVSDCS
jgi:hypothetical protein